MQAVERGLVIADVPGVISLHGVQFLQLVVHGVHLRGQRLELLHTFLGGGVDGAEFGSLEGSKGQITGGLTLAFDKNGTLKSKCLDDITEREIEDIRYHMKRAVGEGMLVSQGTEPGAKGQDAQALLQSLHLAKVATPNGYVLRRAPEIWG